MAKIPKKLFIHQWHYGKNQGESDAPWEDRPTTHKEFAGFFLAKIRKIRDDLASCPAYSPSVIDTKTLGVLQPMTVDNVRKTIMSMPSKSCESDAVPTCLLKRILDKVAGVTSSIINISLEQGVFARSCNCLSLAKKGRS